ncbi:TPA: hypothetical protein N2G38_000654 [Salmonella enterica]|nr:hypothetical protein [Salmonella enterica]
MTEITTSYTPSERNREAPELHHQNDYAGHQQQAESYGDYKFNQATR